MRISDWSSDVCSSDLNDRRIADLGRALHPVARPPQGPAWNLAHLDDLIKPGTTPRPAAVLVPLVERGGSVQVVLTRRTDALRHHGGQVSFPGGGIESRDNGPLAAALREAHEEIGLVRSEERRVGKECVSPCSLRRSPAH